MTVYCFKDLRTNEVLITFGDQYKRQREERDFNTHLIAWKSCRSRKQEERIVSSYVSLHSAQKLKEDKKILILNN